MNIGIPKWINTYVQARINTPPIPPIKTISENLEEYNIIKINMRQDLASATSNTYELKVQTLENGKPEEFLKMMKEFKTTTDRTGTTPATSKFQFIRAMLRGDYLREFDVIASQVVITTNWHLKLIKEVLLS